MHFSTILPAIAVALGAANAAAVDGSVVERRAPHEIELLKLYGVPPGGDFTGVGIPGQCQNLPPNINNFNSAVPTPGFQCTIHTGPHCTGSFITVPNDDNSFLPPDPDSTWKSWKCVCLYC
jgi:hypothetical protein